MFIILPFLTGDYWNVEECTVNYEGRENFFLCRDSNSGLVLEVSLRLLRKAYRKIYSCGYKSSIRILLLLHHISIFHFCRNSNSIIKSRSLNNRTNVPLMQIYLHVLQVILDING